MTIDRRSLAWSVGFAALALAIARRQRKAVASRQLRGKVALITGGSRGLGFAIARELAGRGVRLALTARNSDELQRAKARLVATGLVLAEDVFVQASDVSQPGEIRNVADKATAYFGQIDIVVNNAGIILVGPAESQTLESFQQAMNVNFFGALHTTLAVLPQMLERGNGAIVNIASIGGKVAFPHLLPYVASKFALTGWSQGLRAELTGKGICVTTVSPGIMRTGSHIQARYTGDTAKEYRWFASAASFPGTATDATAAARKTVDALALGTAEIAIGLQAIMAARLSPVAPSLTAGLLSLASRFLPDADGHDEIDRFWEPDTSVSGKAHRGELLGFLERTGNDAISQYNQR